MLLRAGLKIHNCRGQCYDGAANMSGSRTGVKSHFLQREPRALFTHCYGHSLNLAVGDALKNNKVCRDALDVAFEVSKLIRFSPKRSAALHDIKVSKMTLIQIFFQLSYKFLAQLSSLKQLAQ